jgi:hypothetical protein
MFTVWRKMDSTKTKIYLIVNLLQMVVQVDLVSILFATAVANVLFKTLVYNLHVTHSVSKLQKPKQKKDYCQHPKSGPSRGYIGFNVMPVPDIRMASLDHFINKSH